MCVVGICRLHSTVQAVERLGGALVAHHPLLYLDLRRHPGHIPGHEGQLQPCAPTILSTLPHNAHALYL